MPKDPNDYAKYRSYYLDRETSEAGKKKRVARARARREAVDDGRLKGAHDPREVDHIVPMDKGGSSAKSNTRVISRAANRRKFDH